MSVFLALDLDDAVRHEVMTLTAAARARVKAKWLPAEKLHLTLVFLGNPTPAQVHALLPTLDELSATRPFSLSLRGSGTFVTARAPSVLWLGVAGDRAALDALEAAARAVTKQPRTQPWTPHCTLARAHHDGALDPVAAELGSFQSGTFVVKHLTLYESTHHRFHALHTVPLKG